MQEAAHVVERGAILRQRVGMFVDILERDVPCANRSQKLIALPVDPAITDRTARAVPDR